MTASSYCSPVAPVSQLLSSDLHNSLFLMDTIGSGEFPVYESIFVLLYFCLTSFLLIRHAVFRQAVTVSLSIFLDHV